jgi:methyl-accepting chemotaxis protein
MEEFAQTNQQVNQNVVEIFGLSETVSGSLKQTEQVSAELAKASEQVQDMVFSFIVGDGEFHQLIGNARKAREEVQNALGQALKEGHDVFDQRYQPIPNANPPKYKTSYDHKVEKLLQPIIDQVVQKTEGGRFCVAVDSNGYAPTHNSHYSKPLTGEHAVDLALSRDKRIFNDPVGLRAARNANKNFVLQTYTRDSGDILTEIALPIVLGGRHWGALRFGFDPTPLLKTVRQPEALP